MLFKLYYHKYLEYNIIYNLQGSIYKIVIYIYININYFQNIHISIAIIICKYAATLLLNVKRKKSPSQNFLPKLNCFCFPEQTTITRTFELCRSYKRKETLASVVIGAMGKGRGGTLLLEQDWRHSPLRRRL